MRRKEECKINRLGMSLIEAGKGFYFSYWCKDNKMNAKVTHPAPFYGFSQCLKAVLHRIFITSQCKLA